MSKNLTADERKILEDFRSRKAQRTASRVTKSGIDPNERFRLARERQKETDRVRRETQSEASRRISQAQDQARQARTAQQERDRLAELDRKRIAEAQKKQQAQEFARQQQLALTQNTSLRPTQKQAELSRKVTQFLSERKQQEQQKSEKKIKRVKKSVFRKEPRESIGSVVRVVAKDLPKPTVRKLTDDQKRTPKFMGGAVKEFLTKERQPAISLIPSVPEASAEEFVPKERRPFVSGNQNIPKPPTLGTRFITFSPEPERIISETETEIVVQPSSIGQEFTSEPIPQQQQQVQQRKGFAGIIPAIREGEFETEFGQKEKRVAIGDTFERAEDVDVKKQSEDFLEGFVAPFVETGIAVKDVGEFIASDDRENFRGTEIETPSFLTDITGVAISQGIQAFGGEKADPSQTFEKFAERQTEKSLGRIVGETAGEIVLTVGTLGVGKAVQLGAKGATAGVKTAQAVIPKTIVKITKLPKVKVPSKATSALTKQVTSHNKRVSKAQKIHDDLVAKRDKTTDPKKIEELTSKLITAEKELGKLSVEQQTKFGNLVKFGGKGLTVIDEKQTIKFSGNKFTGKTFELGSGIGKETGKGGAKGGAKGGTKPDEFFGGGRSVKTGNISTAKDIFKKAGLKTDEELEKIAKQGGGSVTGGKQSTILKTKTKTNTKTVTKTKQQLRQESLQKQLQKKLTKQEAERAKRQSSALDNLFAKPKAKVKPKKGQRVIVEEQFVRRTRVKPRGQPQLIPKLIPKQVTRIDDAIIPVVRPRVTGVKPKPKPRQDPDLVPILRPPITTPKLKTPQTPDTPPPTRPPPTRITTRKRIIPVPPIFDPRFPDPSRLDKRKASRRESGQGKRLFDVAKTPFGKVTVGLGFFIEQKGDETIAEAIGVPEPKEPKAKRKKDPDPLSAVFGQQSGQFDTTFQF